LKTRGRKFVGTVFILVFVCVYALIGMAVAQMPWLQDAAPIFHGIYYVIFGLGWIVPIIPLISWMERGK